MTGFDHSVIRVDSWNEFKQFVDGLSENWVFRGQVGANWTLKNAIERTDFIKFYNGIEAVFLTEFQRGARNYLNKNETPEHVIEWLALMQHHGAPTRLLDFTKSPFIASYFAFEQCHSRNEAVAVWGININTIRHEAIEILKGYYPEDLAQSNNQINETVFEKIFFENDKSLIFPVEPFRMNRRYSLQQSIFVSTANSSEPFMRQLNFLSEKVSQAVVRIEIPTVAQKEVIRDLQRMNIHRASLFPDLDGYALSLKLKYNSMKTAEESLRQQVDFLDKEQHRLMP
jgi:hypothetical protein